MKSLYLRSCVALACAAGLAGCGAGSGTLLLSGSVVGLVKDGLVLANGSSLDPVAASSTTFQFADLVKTDDNYNVTIQTQPTGAVCAVQDGSGTVGLYSIASVIVTCVTDTHPLGVDITGFNPGGLVLTNGGDESAPLFAANTSVTFTVPDGSPYGIAVLVQPATATCTVVNGTGHMGAQAMPDAVQVNCVAN